MSGRTDMSTTLQDPNVESASSAMASIALIGPNATHRRVMAKALTGTESRAVREFIDYPANLGDIPHLMEESFDVVMIDVDSDQSYALQIIESVAAYNTSVVMAYSMRNDADLIRDCMRAGARDFLPLPEDASVQAGTEVEVEAESESEPEVQAAPEVALQIVAAPPAAEPKPVAEPTIETALGIRPIPVPRPEPGLNPADFLRTPEPEVQAAEEAPLDPKDFLLATPREVPETSSSTKEFHAQDYAVPSRPTFVESRRPAPVAQPSIAAQTGSAAHPIPIAASVPAPPVVEVRRPEPAPTQHIQPEELRRTAAAAANPEEGAAPELKKDEEINEWDSLWIHPALVAAGKIPADSILAQPEAKAPQKAAPILSGPQLVQRAAAAHVEPEPAPAAPLFRAVDDQDASSEGQRPWVRWAIIGGAATAVIGLIMMIFLPSHRSEPATSQTQPAPVQTQTQPNTADASAVQAKPSAKPSAANPGIVPVAQTVQAPVSSEMMNAQLNAPSRISGSLKKNTQQAEEPPSSFAPGGIDNGSTLPGQVFGGSGVKVEAGRSAISAGVAEGMLIHRTSPVYPEIAKSAHVSGTVALGANITKAGTLTNLHVLSGPTMLRNSAVDAVKTWRYRPYLLNNQPVEVETTIRVVFSLER